MLIFRSRELEAFLASRQRNAWLRIYTYDAYVRKGHHLVDGKLLNTLDLANVENERARRGSGLFHILLGTIDEAIRETPLQGIFVESVLNDRLAKTLPQLGFALVPNTFPPCFYRPKGGG